MAAADCTGAADVSTSLAYVQPEHGGMALAHACLCWFLHNITAFHLAAFSACYPDCCPGLFCSAVSFPLHCSLSLLNP